MLYRMKSDDAHYLMLTYSDEYMLEAVRANVEENKPGIIADPSPHILLPDWQQTEVLFVDGYPEFKFNKVAPDISYTTGRLFLNQRALDALKPFLEKGEILPVLYESGTKGYIFNPLDIVKASKHSTKNEFGDITHISFNEEHTLFKTDFDGYNGVFCDQAVRDTIEKAGLKGLVFDVDLANIFLDDGTSCKPKGH